MADISDQKQRQRRSRLFVGCLAVVGVVVLSSLVGTAVGLVKAFGVVGEESVDPSQKARILAEGISEAMNCSAFGVVVGLIVGVPLLVRWLVLSRRKDEGENASDGGDGSTDAR